MPRNKTTNRIKSISEVIQTTKITKFFHKGETAQDKVQNQPAKAKNERNTFYKNRAVVGGKKKSLCVQQKCIEMKNKAMSKLKDVKEKREKTERALQVVEAVLKKKDDKIRALKTECQSRNHLIQSANPINLYIDFKDDFDENELAKLRSIDGSKKSDSTFIRYCLQYMYKNEMSRLKTISVTGRNRTGQQKIPMSPTKSNILNKIFNERLSAQGLVDSEEIQRKSRLNIHIGHAIGHSARSKKGELKELNDKINLVQK